MVTYLHDGVCESGQLGVLLLQQDSATSGEQAAIASTLCCVRTDDKTFAT
jgi:hypothetical protein